MVIHFRYKINYLSKPVTLILIDYDYPFRRDCLLHERIAFKPVSHYYIRHFYHLSLQPQRSLA